MSVERWITVIVGIGGILAMIDSGIQRFWRAGKSRYAAERDFEHLKKNQEQFKQNLKVIMDESDELKEDVIRVQAKLDTLIAIQKER